VNDPIRLVVVDDHALFRRGLIALLSEMSEFEIVGEAGDGADAVPIILKQQPHVVLLDINMPGMDGLQTLEALAQTDSEARILMLTISQQEQDLIGAIVAGASGYLLKNAEPDILRRTIQQVAAGKSVLSPEMTERVFDLMRREPVSTAPDLLSERELDVLRCLARGLTTSQIALDLFISENTVKTHIRHILKKMGVNNRAEAVAKAIEAGFLKR
jgi:two-component system nitrate/nitrite response regulator NarL